MALSQSEAFSDQSHPVTLVPLVEMHDHDIAVAANDLNSGLAARKDVLRERGLHHEISVFGGSALGVIDTLKDLRHWEKNDMTIENYASRSMIRDKVGRYVGSAVVTAEVPTRSHRFRRSSSLDVYTSLIYAWTIESDYREPTLNNAYKELAQNAGRLAVPAGQVARPCAVESVQSPKGIHRAILTNTGLGSVREGKYTHRGQYGAKTQKAIFYAVPDPIDLARKTR